MPAKSLTLKDVKPQDFISAFSAHLKKSAKITLPKNSDIIKTAVAKESSPLNEDWYYVRLGKQIDLMSISCSST